MSTVSSSAAAEYLSVDPEELGRLCRLFGIAELSVFGSVARHEDGPDSDVDLLYTLDPDSELGWAIEELNDQLAVALGRQVDLVSKKYLNRLLRDQILRDAVIVYAA